MYTCIYSVKYPVATIMSFTVSPFLTAMFLKRWAVNITYGALVGKGTIVQSAFAGLL